MPRARSISRVAVLGKLILDALTLSLRSWVLFPFFPWLIWCVDRSIHGIRGVRYRSSGALRRGTLGIDTSRCSGGERVKPAHGHDVRPQIQPPYLPSWWLEQKQIYRHLMSAEV